MEPVMVGCTKHGECLQCRLDSAEDEIQKNRGRWKDLWEEFHDAQRAARGDSGNPRSGDST